MIAIAAVVWAYFVEPSPHVVGQSSAMAGSVGAVALQCKYPGQGPPSRVYPILGYRRGQ